jgi:hypothetical protein
VALTPTVEGATSAATDLNQIVNLLNGTDTATQMTVNGPISAQLTGATAPMRYVGGLAAPGPTHTGNWIGDGFKGFYAPTSIPLTQGAADDQSNGSYYGLADLAWLPGGPIAIGAGSATAGGWATDGFGHFFPNQNSQLNIGAGGYMCRVHQAAAVTVSAINQNVTGDTVDFDPRGMFQTTPQGGSGINLPFGGNWFVLAGVHGSGVNSMNVQWELAVINDSGGGAIAAVSLPAPSSPADNTNKYTGAAGWGIVNVADFLATPGNPSYIALRTLGTPGSSFSLDVSGADRTYLAAYLLG